jgi:hypothetical protein
MVGLKIMYLANIIVAGWISINSLLYPELARVTVFSGKVSYSEVIRLVGALWGAIFLLSVLGLWFPQKMQLVLLVQLLYKSSWILIVALPAQLKNQPYPKEMSVFFIVWILLLPFIIDWNYLFHQTN